MTEEQLIAGIRQKPGSLARRKAVEWICTDKKFNVAPRKRLLSLGARPSDIGDIFQEARMVFIRQIELDNFDGKSSLHIYFKGICRIVYLKKYQKNKARPRLVSISQVYTSENIEQKIIKEEQQGEFVKLMEYVLGFFSEDCQKIIFMRFHSFKRERIAREMDYQVVSKVSKKLYKCRQRFRKLMKENEEVRRIINNRLHGKF